MSRVLGPHPRKNLERAQAIDLACEKMAELPIWRVMKKNRHFGEVKFSNVTSFGGFPAMKEGIHLEKLLCLRDYVREHDLPVPSSSIAQQHVKVPNVYTVCAQNPKITSGA